MCTLLGGPVPYPRSPQWLSPGPEPGVQHVSVRGPPTGYHRMQQPERKYRMLPARWRAVMHAFVAYLKQRGAAPQ